MEDVAGCVGETMCKFVFCHLVLALDRCNSHLSVPCAVPFKVLVEMIELTSISYLYRLFECVQFYHKHGT